MLCRPSSLLLCAFLALGLPLEARGDIAGKVAPCEACHGEEGRAGPDGFYPRIAGKPANYLYNQLVNFREGRRIHDVMAYMVDRQTDAYLLEMARYFSGLKLPYPEPPALEVPAQSLAAGEALARRGSVERDVPGCGDCHGRRLTGVAPAVPGLLGLPRDYLLAQFGAWRSGSRRAAAPDCMGTIARRLTDRQIQDVTNWLATLPVPADSSPDGAAPRRLREDCRIP